MTMVDGLAYLLQFADGFIEQSHFPESDPEVVMGLRIFFRAGNFFLAFVPDLAEHIRQIDAGGTVGRTSMVAYMSRRSHRCAERGRRWRRLGLSCGCQRGRRRGHGRDWADSGRDRAGS